MIAAVAALVVAGASTPAHAEDVEAIVRHGIELRRQGHDAEALTEFQRAMRIQRSPRTQAQIALAEQALGLWPGAEADLLAALDAQGDAWIKKNRTTLANALTIIQSQ